MVLGGGEMLFIYLTHQPRKTGSWALVLAESCGQDHGGLPEFNASQGIRGWAFGILCLSRLHGPLLSGSGGYGGAAGGSCHTFLYPHQ